MIVLSKIKLNYHEHYIMMNSTNNFILTVRNSSIVIRLVVFCESLNLLISMRFTTDFLNSFNYYSQVCLLSVVFLLEDGITISKLLYKNHKIETYLSERSHTETITLLFIRAFSHFFGHSKLHRVNHYFRSFLCKFHQRKNSALSKNSEYFFSAMNFECLTAQKLLLQCSHNSKCERI